jgi:hypothetical protein
MDYNELLFASAIITRSSTLRLHSKSNFRTDNPQSDMEEWEKNNPDTKFILLALEEAKSVSKFIREQSPE